MHAGISNSLFFCRSSSFSFLALFSFHSFFREEQTKKEERRRQRRLPSCLLRRCLLLLHGFFFLRAKRRSREEEKTTRKRKEDRRLEVSQGSELAFQVVETPSREKILDKTKEDKDKEEKKKREIFLGCWIRQLLVTMKIMNDRKKKKKESSLPILLGLLGFSSLPLASNEKKRGRKSSSKWRRERSRQREREKEMFLRSLLLYSKEKRDVFFASIGGRWSRGGVATPESNQTNSHAVAYYSYFCRLHVKTYRYIPCFLRIHPSLYYIHI